MRWIMLAMVILCCVLRDCRADDGYFAVRIETNITASGRSRIKAWAASNLPLTERTALCDWGVSYRDGTDTNKFVHLWHPNIRRDRCPFGPLALTTNDIRALALSLPVADRTKVRVCTSDGQNWKTRLGISTNVPPAIAPQEVPK